MLVTAKSETQTCILNLNLKAIPNANDIVDKISLKDKSFKVDSVSGLNLQLDQYFGGANLEYKLPEESNTNKDFTFNIRHLNKYTFTPTFAKTEVTAVLHLTPSSFYYIGVNSISEFKIYIDLCNLKDEKVEC